MGDGESDASAAGDPIGAFDSSKDVAEPLHIGNAPELANDLFINK
jgi:hypothetical protein